MTQTKTFGLHHYGEIKAKVLNWLQQFNTFCFLDSNLYEHKTKTHEILIGAGIKRRFENSGSETLLRLQHFIDEKKSWLFGHLAYELPTSEHASKPELEDKLLFSDACFFEPSVVLHIKQQELKIVAQNPDSIYEQIMNAQPVKNNLQTHPIEVQQRLTRQAYINIVQQLQQHIHRGDCYEINFCQEFFAENAFANPFDLFEKLNKVSPNPFSALYRIDDKWLLCASPERFLQKKGRHIISQPIKGTWPRKSRNQKSIKQEKQQLLNSAKEKAENVMVVDLVRNDLSRICRQGTVQVDELFGIYSFPQVHQMISTVSGELTADTTFTNIINATFPMGSMTGAPKVNVMRLVDKYETGKRGIFSGTLGYINPDGDFDFNVVIRSLMYNQTTKYLSFMAGSGITIYADAEKEWEECMVKAKAIRKILQ
ncbi:MAG: anthranilate synthase component I family protein [Niabella sp.]